MGDRAFDALKTIQQWASETGPGNLQCKTGRAQGGLVYQLKDLKLAAPLPVPSKFICLLHNYVDYLEGLNRPFPARPRFFAKFPTTIIGPGEYIIHPWLSRQVGYEAELAVVIGRRGKSIPEEEAYDYVAGYTIVNDISAVDIIAQDGQVMCGKNFDTFAPMGPWIITKDEIPDPQNLRICLDVNGRVLQDSNTSKMLFPIPVVISYLSKVMTLEPGDIIATGTPAGTPQFYDPPAFLDPGDIVTAKVEYIGHLTNPVIQEVSS
ncbi:MAG TPA: fumarylacetoacetate hydrolase family protein [Firmicutes bacterium]|nr:fumarylacetoacetate hydrolase family protein [Bacillota bacterium]